MRARVFVSASQSALVCAVLLSAACVHNIKQTTAVEIRTSLGPIVVVIEDQKAPVTARNFLTYVDAHAYHGSTFYRATTLDNQSQRAVKIEIIQGGIQGATNPDSNVARAPIPLERTNKSGLTHRAGTISMARDVPDSATTEFFICVTDQPELDFGGARNPDGQGFAGFGQVIEGMDIVRKIQSSPSSGELLDPPIGIGSISRIRNR